VSLGPCLGARCCQDGRTERQDGSCERNRRTLEADVGRRKKEPRQTFVSAIRVILRGKQGNPAGNLPSSVIFLSALRPHLGLCFASCRALVTLCQPPSWVDFPSTGRHLSTNHPSHDQNFKPSHVHSLPPGSCTFKPIFSPDTTPFLTFLLKETKKGVMLADRVVECPRRQEIRAPSCLRPARRAPFCHLLHGRTEGDIIESSTDGILLFLETVCLDVTTWPYSVIEGRFDSEPDYALIAYISHQCVIRLFDAFSAGKRPVPSSLPTMICYLTPTPTGRASTRHRSLTFLASI
jgi:hypothetical protein